MNLFTIESALDTISNSGKKTGFTLGSVTFTGIEVPESVQYGGNQNLIVQKLPGGWKVIDDGGNDPLTINMRGIFLGSDAKPKSDAITQMRMAGKTVAFTAAAQTLRVKIRAFTCEYRRMGYYIPWQITLEVYPSKTSSHPDPTQTLKGGIGGAISTLTKGISDVANIGSAMAGSAQAVLGQITPIATVIGVGGPVQSASNFLSTAQGITSTASNLSNLPTALAGTVSNIKSVTDSLNTSISQAEANISSIMPNNAASLTAAAQNSTILEASIEAKQAAQVAGDQAQKMGVQK